MSATRGRTFVMTLLALAVIACGRTSTSRGAMASLTIEPGPSRQNGDG